MKFRLVRERIERAVAGDQAPDSATGAAHTLLGKLAKLDDLDAEEVIAMLAMLKPKKPPAIDKDQASRTAESRALVELKATFESDADFRAALQRLKADRSITREGLNRLFCELFDRSRPLTTKATREKLVQDIADLRLERVRSKRAAEYFSGKVA